MNIELRFLQKAIEDKNYINFTYKQKKYQKIEPLKLEKVDTSYFLVTKEVNFEFNLIKNLIILKNKFN
ncbi:hypothetical protein [Poseidonibacter ostreae]|jgi:hypothetical protein|uniref:Uncharacterized protein n=1 Tax=Poseidonibacter ostreae TaxID=2654171 RepID=A0A6L4WX69_9BACT|nr:hypothetical protein [Poseidonibacter ostreae]KAB7884682.1 hypothetical protein GA417_10745 [Poseidonibacter ostreae]KAB7889969.1 hypothetical protein GBG19_04360 [Poseidonibacter ostreae]KAB7891483.1 hypothetical protein GBG18_06920 [Poseidonibacter ostreae]MAC83097.1 hypothetical protein [Arcobacter sp.]